MPSRSLALAVTIAVVGAVVAFADDESNATAASKRNRKYPPQMPGATAEVYKTVGDTKLNIYIFNPRQHELNESRPAIVFFFGGGWRSGTPAQFEQHCRYLSSRGMVAMTADYRVLSRHKTKANASVMDGKSAVRWIRQHARRLGVDPDRIIAGGGSAGGHVAACTATLADFDQPGEDLAISSKPNGLALFNPAVVLAEVKGWKILSEEKLADLSNRLGVPPAQLSPFHQLEPGLPPTIIFHGKDDTTVPFRSVEIFAEKAKSHGDDVVLAGYEAEGHGFFNFGRNDNLYYSKTMQTLDAFLVDRGLLEGPSPKEIVIW